MSLQKGAVRRSLYFSILDGLFTAMMLGASDGYVIPYGIALGATPSQVAFLATIPALIGSVLQIGSASLTQHIGSRLRLIRWVVFFHAVLWLPIIAIPYAMKHGTGSFAPWALVLAVVASMIFATFAAPAWQSLLYDYIPSAKRGHYWGWRNRMQGILTTLISVGAGLLLHYFGKDQLLGFTVIFVFAMFCRFFAWGCILGMVEPFRKSSHDVYFSFLDFLKRIRGGNFGRFVLFVSLMSFSVNVSAPLLTVFILKDLGYSYAVYMALVTGAVAANFMTQPLWGRYGDRVGNAQAMKVAGWGIAVIPLFWMFSRNPFYLFVVQCFAGSVWGGFNLVLLNFMIESVKPEKRIRCISYFNVMNSSFVFLGAVLGGFAIRGLPPLFGYSFLSLFLLSCFLRTAVMTLLAKKVLEIRRLQGV